MSTLKLIKQPCWFKGCRFVASTVVCPGELWRDSAGYRRIHYVDDHVKYAHDRPAPRTDA